MRFQPLERNLEGLFTGDRLAVDCSLPRPFGNAGIKKSVTAPVADEIAIDGRAKAGFLTEDLPIAGTHHRVAPEGAIQADGRRALVVPAPSLEARGLIGENAGGAYIGDVAGVRTLQCSVRLATEIDAISALHDAEVAVAAIFLIEPGTAIALNAAVHLVLDQGAEVLIGVGAFFPRIAS